MNHLSKGFLKEAVPKVQMLRAGLHAFDWENGDVSDKRRFVRQLFQQIHTLKGTASAFEIENVVRLAHRLEDLVSRLDKSETTFDTDTLEIIEAGLCELENALQAAHQQRKYQVSSDFEQQISSFTENLPSPKNTENLDFMPSSFRDQLNERETAHLIQLIAEKKDIVQITAEFSYAGFQAEITAMHSKLLESGEIVASLPAESVAPDKITLALIYAPIQHDDWADTIDARKIEILSTYQTKIIRFSEVAAVAVLAGKQAAAKLGKKIKFEIFGANTLLNLIQAEALSIALLHIVRNAVAHGIESPNERGSKNEIGKITITDWCESNNENVAVTITDDGKGIDYPKIAAASRQNKLSIEPQDFGRLNQLLFDDFVTTAEHADDFSGRGVGLPAALAAVEQINGKINVTSQVGRETTFEIVVPK